MKKKTARQRGGADEADLLQAEELGKLTEPLYVVPDEDLRTVAFHVEMGCSSQLKKYKEAFMKGFALSHMPRPCVGDRVDAAGDCNVGHGGAAFDDCLAAQKQLFDFKRVRGAQPDVGAEGVPSASSAAGVPVVQDCPEAHLVIAPDGLLRPRDFVQQCVYELASRTKDPVELGAEQMDFLALVVAKVEALQAYTGRQLRGEAIGESAPEQAVMFLHGQGGSGKTEVVGVCRKLFRHVFGEGGDIAMASSNSAARVIGGDTIHSVCHMHGEMGLTVDKLSRGITDVLKDRWRDVSALIIEEISMVSPRLLGAASYRISEARRASHGVDPLLYCLRGHMFGNIPIVIMLGDFMQLAPFEYKGRVSLLMPPRDSSSTEHLNGLKIFWDGLTDVCFLRKTFRFRDKTVDPPRECKVLPALFQYMRDSGGKPMPEWLWTEVCKWKARGTDDPRCKQGRRRAGYEMAIAWEAVARLMQYRAVREAADAKKMVMYVQAIDVARKQRLPDREYRRALQVVNMTTTGSRMGLCPVFLGMRVRLTAKVSAKHQIVQDAVGEVVDVVLDDREFAGGRRDWRDDAAHPSRLRGCVRLRHMPRAVLVRFDEHAADVGFGPGVVAVRPMGANWKYLGHDGDGCDRRPTEIAMRRYQIPLAPEKDRTVQTAQGLSMDSATMFLERPGNMSHEDWWLHVYVMLSRVRTADQILVYGLPPRALFEQGPPRYIRDGLERLEKMAAAHRPRVTAARSALNWEELLKGRGSLPHPPEVPRCGEDFSNAPEPEAAGDGGTAMPTGQVTGDDGSVPAPQYDDDAGEFYPEVKGHDAAASDGSAEDDPTSGPSGSVLGRPWDLPLYRSRTAQLAPSDGSVDVALLVPLEAEMVETLYRATPASICNPPWLIAATPSRGMPNCGNTCFVNAALQVLLRVEGFAKILMAHSHAGGPSRTCIACSLAAEAAAMRRGVCAKRSPVALLARDGRFGEAFSGDGRTGSGRQCDAAEFAQAVMDALDDYEVNRCVALRQASRSVLLDYVWGGVFRSRTRCAQCGAVSDRLVQRGLVEVEFGVYAAGKVTLRQLWEQHCAETRSPGTACPERTSTGCRGLGYTQTFLEREPPVLCFWFRRGWQRWQDAAVVGEGKHRALLDFPETLECMRSGPYHFAGAVMHRGARVSSGHYVAGCWLGDRRYAEFNDETESPQTWAYFQSNRVQQDVYILLYVRTSSWNESIGDGGKHTPYARDDQSVLLGSVRGAGDPALGVAVRGRAAADGRGAPDDSPLPGLSPGCSSGMTDASASDGLAAAASCAGFAAAESRPVEGASSESWKERKETAEAITLSLGGPGAPVRTAVSGQPTHGTRTSVSSSCARVDSEFLAVGAAGRADAMPQAGKRDASGDAVAIDMPLGAANSGMGRRVRSRIGVSGAVGSDATQVEASAVDVASETLWRRFTPDVVNEGLCLARTWAQGRGAQCGRRRLEGNDLCGPHVAGEKWRQHGLVTGPIPEKKLAEFLKASLSASASGPG